MSPDHLHAFLQWDVRSWSRVLPLWDEALQGTGPKEALALGEREGGLSLWLALQGHKVTCTDLGPLPEATAQLHARFGVQDRIRYAEADATAIPFPDRSFDLVIFKSMIGALSTKADQAKAIAEMHRVLRPGGLLLFAENLTGTALHRSLRKRFIAWDRYWRYLRWPADADLFAPFTRCVFRTYGLTANLGRSEGQRRWLSHVDDVLAPLVPSSWRYILAGACHKGPAHA